MSPSRIRRSAVFALVVAAVFVASLLIHREAGLRPYRQSLESLKKLQFQGAEKQVVEKVKKLIAEVQADPSLADAWGLLAMNLDVHDMENEALDCYKNAARLNPADFRWPYYQALLIYERNPAESIVLFERSLQLRPDFAAARIRYARALMDSGRMEQASAEFEKAVDADSVRSHGYVGMARIAVAQGKLDEAASHLRKAVQSNPGHGEAHGLLSEVYRRLNDPQKARAESLVSQQLPKKTPLPDEAESALMKEGVSSYWYDVRGRAALQAGDYAAAALDLKAAAEAAGDPFYYDTLGVAYLYQRKYEAAVSAHKKSLELNPRSTTSLNNLAAALYETGQRDEALNTVRKALGIDRGHAYSYLHLARLNLRSGNPAAAVEAYRSGLQQLPQNPDLALQLAWLRAVSKEASIRNGAEAVELAESVARRTPDAETLDVLAAAYAEAGRFDLAVRAAEQALARAGAAGAGSLAQRIETRMVLYRSNRPYRE